MSCIICEDIELEIPRCHKCGRLPTNTQLAILTEAFDNLDVLHDGVKAGVVSTSIYGCLKTLTGVVRYLVVENTKLKRELLVLNNNKFN